MNRYRTIILLLLVPLFAFVGPSAAAAATTISATGTFTQTSFTVTESHTAGNLTFMSFTETDALAGTFEGTSVIVGECIFFPSGEGMCKATETFTGTVNGALGTLVLLDQIRINTTTGEASGRFEVVGGSGDLAGVRGQGSFSGVNGAGTYSGTLILAP
jgi:hypothetical protein